MSPARNALLAGLAALAVVSQVVVLRHVAIDGVVPDLALVVVVVVAIRRGPEAGAALGFAAGLLLDLAPPADHVAGRWALALVLAGFLAGRVREDARSSTLTSVLVVGACSFVATSVFALSGALLHDGTPDAGSMVPVIALSVLWDVLLAPFLVPPLNWLLDRMQPAEAAW